MKILLDTNMIYNLMEVENVNISLESINKLEELMNENQVFVTSITLFEVVTKFSEDFINIKKIFTKINQEFIVIQVPYMPFKREWISKILFSKCSSDITNTIKEILNLKIMKEAEFIRLYQNVILSVISWTMIESNYDELKDDTDILEKVMHYLKCSISGNISYNLECNVEYLKHGYNEKTPQKNMKICFDKDIKHYIFIFKAMYYTAINGVDLVNIKDSTEEQRSKVIEDLNKDKFVCDIKQGNDIDFFSKKKYRKIIRESIDDVQEAISKLQIFKESNTIFKYFMNKILKILFKNAKFKNNDITDMLILYPLDFCEDLVLISNDNNIKNFLCDINHRSYSIIKEII